MEFLGESLPTEDDEGTLNGFWTSPEGDDDSVRTWFPELAEMDLMTSFAYTPTEEVTGEDFLGTKSGGDTLDEEETECVSYIPKFEEIVFDGDDAFFGSTLGMVPSVHISQMRICSREDAERIGCYVLEVLEEDLYHYFNSFDADEYGQGEVNAKKILDRHYSNASIDSNYSDPPPGEPSTLNLFYEYEATTLRRNPFAPPGPVGVDVETEVNIHRRKLDRPKVKDAGTMTREMTFVDTLTAQLVFRHLYPQKDDYSPPVVSSRQASLDDILGKAKETEPGVDAPRIGPKVRWSSQRRLLPPLPQDYFKEDTFWTGSVFKGQYIGRELSKGRFEYPLMSVYESEFKGGHAHTEKHLGSVIYPRGDKFEGEWVKGRHVTGKITFADELKFEQHNWGYCNPPDRRFYIERDIGIKEVGKTLYNDRFPAPFIPPGHYDTGYGVFNPDTGELRGYSGEKIRNASYPECKWVMSACRKVKKVEERYKPSFSENRIPGSSVNKFQQQS